MEFHVAFDKSLFQGEEVRLKARFVVADQRCSEAVDLFWADLAAFLLSLDVAGIPCGPVHYVSTVR